MARTIVLLKIKWARSAMAFIWMLLVDLMLLPIWILKMLLIIPLIWLGILDLMEDFLKLSRSVIKLWAEKIITMLMSIHLESIHSKYEYYFLKLYLFIDCYMRIYLIIWPFLLGSRSESWYQVFVLHFGLQFHWTISIHRFNCGWN